ncbi:HDOD domain-containing protein [Candidatus Latescibacterota bacterium]
MDDETSAEREYALVIQQAKRPPQAMLAYLRLMLNYLYGLEVLTAHKHAEVASLAIEYGADIRAVFLVQDENILNRNAMSALSRRGKLPVLLLLPGELAPAHEGTHGELPNIHVSAWDQALGATDASIQTVVTRAFEANGIDRLLVDSQDTPNDQMRERIQGRLSHISALPTLPEIVFRLMELLADPETSAEDVEKLLTADPAIVLKILQVASSAAFAGARQEGEWTLKEAIVRLGHRQVAAIAQQVTLVSALAKPLQSKFDLRRFWEHSVGTAMVAHRLCAQKHVTFSQPPDFNAYWISSLLHDVGKLLLGFLSWDYFDEVLGRAATQRQSFGRAEEQLGHCVTHEYLGKLLLLGAGASEEVAAAVGAHDTTGVEPSDLAALVHVANNLCKDMGLGYLPQERADYLTSALQTLNTTAEEMGSLAESLGDEMTAEIRELVDECTPA